MLQDPVVRAQAGKPSYGGGLFDTVRGPYFWIFRDKDHVDIVI